MDFAFDLNLLSEEIEYLTFPLDFVIRASGSSANIEELDAAAEGLPIVREKLNQKVKTAMSNSFGFGGTNASLVFSTKNL